MGTLMFLKGSQTLGPLMPIMTEALAYLIGS